MMNIIKTLIAAFICTATLVTATQAADPLAVWEAQLQTALANNEAIVQQIAKSYRDVNCPQQSTAEMQKVCVAAYNVDIAREKLERSEIELLLTTTSLSASQRDTITKLVSDYGTFDQQTHAFGDQLDLLFPGKSKSSSLDK